MTKTELKDIIKECLYENGIIHEAVNIYYRITYEGKGIYNELKKAMTKTENGRKEWREFLQRDKWLNNPTIYEEHPENKYHCYFTKVGFNKFKQSYDYKLMKKYLDNNKIEINTYTIDDKDIVYRDENQITIQE